MDAVKRAVNVTVSHIYAFYRLKLPPAYSSACCLAHAGQSVDVMLVFDPSVINTVQTFKAYYYWPGYWLLLSWGDPCGVTRSFVSHSIVRLMNDPCEDRAVAWFPFPPRRRRSTQLHPLGRSVSYLGPPLCQRRSEQSPVSCIGCSPRTSHMPTRVQHAHTQPCRHATDSNLACMITATLSCLGVLSHLALVFVAYPAACPAALVHRI